MKSTTLPLYKKWLATATTDEIERVDAIYAACEKHYNQGGDTVVESFDPREVLSMLKTVQGARRYCRLRIDLSEDNTWCEDTDRSLAAELQATVDEVSKRIVADSDLEMDIQTL